MGKIFFPASAATREGNHSFCKRIPFPAPFISGLCFHWKQMLILFLLRWTHEHSNRK
jgi:hypothetical protein